MSLAFDHAQLPPINLAIAESYRVAADAEFEPAELVAVRPAYWSATVLPAYWQSLDVEKTWLAVFVKPNGESPDSLEFLRCWLGESGNHSVRDRNLPFPQGSARYRTPWPSAIPITAEQAVRIADKEFCQVTGLKYARITAVTLWQPEAKAETAIGMLWSVLADFEHSEPDDISMSCTVDATTGDVKLQR